MHRHKVIKNAERRFTKIETDIFNIDYFYF
jgi:hypothetical protein